MELTAVRGADLQQPTTGRKWEIIMNYYTQLLLENIDNRADKLLKTGYAAGWNIDRFLFEIGMLQRKIETMMTAALGQDVFCFYGTLFVIDGDEDIPIHTIRNVSYFSPNDITNDIATWNDWNEIPVGRHFHTAFGDVIIDRWAKIAD